MTPHKHAEVIKAWADGAKIQYRNPAANLTYWSDVGTPAWFEHFEYRVKPQPKKCVPYKRFLCRNYRDVVVELVYKDNYWRPDESRDVFIKWIDTEWQEHEYDA